MSRSMWIALAIACLMTGVWSWAATLFVMEQGDFPAFYTGAQVARSGELHRLHDVELQARLQKQATGAKRPRVTYFVRPHIYAAVLAPLAFTDIHTAYRWFLLGSGAILLAVAVWGAREFGPDALILLSLFPIPIFAAGFGQDCVLYLGIVVASFHLHTKERPFAAGLVLGLAAIKPHLLLLVPLAMLLQQRWRMLAGFALTVAAEALGSLALGGWSGAVLYLNFLGEQRRHLSPHPERMLNLDSLLVNAGLNGFVLLKLVLMVAVLVLLYLACGKREWWRGLAAGIAGTLILAPHTIPYDAAWMVLPAWLVFFRSTSRLARSAAAVFFTPLPYLLQLADQPWSGLPACALIFLTAAMAWDAFAGSRAHTAAAPAFAA